MAKENIRIGAQPNDKTGDSLREAFRKVNANFTELYTSLGLNDTTLNLGNFVFEENTIRLTNVNNDDSTLTQIEIAQPVRIESDLTVGGDIVPSVANGGNLGSLAKPFRSLYVSNNTVFLGGVPLSLEPGTNELRVNNVPISQTITYADIPNSPTVPTDVSDLTDTGGLLGGSPTNVKLESPGDRRIEEVYGYKSVSVTARGTINLTAIASRDYTGAARIWVNSTTTTIDEILNDTTAAGITDNTTIEFSVDNTNWYRWAGTEFDGDDRGFVVNLNGATLTYSQGDTVYFRYVGGAAPVVWWNKSELPGGSSDFRGAVIDYHAYTGESTIIGTIHIVDDDGEEHITHTEVQSGTEDGENDDLWVVTDEGQIKYRRIDSESKTLKIQWAAKVFYGSEAYD
jgi:hypothetical protein